MKIQDKERPALPLEDLTMGELIDRTCAGHAGRPALWYKGRTWTYRELREEILRSAGAFAALGIRKGDQVVLRGETEPAIIFAYYALQYMGAVAVMVNPMLGQEELQTVLDAVDPCMICSGVSYKTWRNIGEEAKPPAKLPLYTFGSTTLEGVSTLESVRDSLTGDWRQRITAMKEAVDPQDTAVILYTSGSTSAPKAVCSSHYSRVNGGIQQSYDLHADETDSYCISIPIFHCFCISANLMAAMATGGCLCIPDDRHTESILTCIERAGCTVLNSVPTMFHALIHKAGFSRERVRTLRTGLIGGAHYAPETFREIEDAIGFRLMSSLGQTETTAGLSVCYMDDSLEVRSTTVGHFMSHVEGRIVDHKTGRVLPAGEPGEICVRGYLNMQEYYHRPDLTKQAVDQEGFIHTGDLGVLDEDGNIVLKGRIRELIIRGGENISPNEIESVLALLKKTTAVKAVGIPDTHYGEEICLCIQRRAGTELTKEEVHDFLSSRLTCYKVPKYILFWDELPRTASGKISGRLCAARAKEELRDVLS